MVVFKKNNLGRQLNCLNLSDEIFLDFESDISAPDIEKLMTKFTFDKIILNNREIDDFLIK
tara:strand:- start:315 stop:497 length:183 start_codon:yes stop_codon:yes gene_type:complete